jgi:hypothetical protein
MNVKPLDIEDKGNPAREAINACKEALKDKNS